MSEPWYKRAVFYEVYVRAFSDSNGDGHGDLRGLMSKLDYIKDLGVDCIWLLPIYPSPLRDDGYDIADYYGVLKEYGTVEDFRALIDAVHARGMRLIADLVMNHTSDQCEWFQQSRSSRDNPYRDWYVWSDSDQIYKDARIIFTDTEKSNWTWDEVAGQYFWHRFFSTQPDLNFDNPAVREEMKKIAQYWMDMGIDGFRTDAVPYLFEREGTNCENLPETHDYLKEIRKLMDERYPGCILLCEANQWPEDVRPYFGDGDEFHMGFHFPAMPRIFKSIRAGRADSLIEILNRTPAIPENTQWCTFLRNHDELTLEMVSEEDRQWMWREYAPEPRMRLNMGIRRRLAPLLDNDQRKLALANSLLFTLPGSPILYYGDEIGMGDDIWMDDRNGVRTPMQWSAGQNAGFSAAAPDKMYAKPIHDALYGFAKINVAAQQGLAGSQFERTKQMIATYKQHPALATGDFAWADVGGQVALAAFYRRGADETILALNNVSGEAQSVKPGGVAAKAYRDLFSGERIPAETEFHLEPYGYRWLAVEV
jgi:maltose alpha-D-glucosyltransferase / alpha-amylase